MAQSHDELRGRQAAEPLQIQRLLEGKPQEVSSNCDSAERRFPLLTDAYRLYAGAGRCSVSSASGSCDRPTCGEIR
jgi:hypothetical protein